MKPILRHFAVLFATATLFGEIQHNTSVNDVDHQGPDERAGSITMRILDNDFQGASPDEPLFLRLSLDHGARLAHTLVNLAGEESTVNRPIYLAIRLNAPDGVVLNAPPESVAVVRWVAGESAIWIRIQSDSSLWLSDGQTQFPPDADRSVQFTLGISARLSRDSLEGLPPTQVNLPFNTRNPDVPVAAASPADAVSTMICADLSDSTLTVTGVESLLMYDPILFDHTAIVSHGVYRPGAQVGISFGCTGCIIARGKTRDCSVNALSTDESDDKESGGEASGASEGGIASPEDKILSVDSQLLLRGDCRLGGVYLDQSLFPGARLTLSTENRQYGFAADSVIFLGSSPGIFIVDPDSAFTIHGRVFYRRGELIWDGGERPLSNQSITASIIVYQSIEYGASEAFVDWSFFNPSGRAAPDDPPFQGPDQNLFCQPYEQLLGSGQWRLGAFNPPAQIIAHLANQEGGFATRLLIANTSEEPEDYVLSGYRQSGELLTQIEGRVEGLATEEFDAAALLGPEASHAAVTAAPSVYAVAAYRSTQFDSGSAHVRASMELARRWRIFPGKSSLLWDGLTALNRGEETAAISIAQYDGDGALVQRRELAEALPVNGKTLAVLSDLFEAAEGGYFEIEADQPIAVLAFRGDWSRLFLWENRAMPIPD